MDSPQGIHAAAERRRARLIAAGQRIITEGLQALAFDTLHERDA